MEGDVKMLVAEVCGITKSSPVPVTLPDLEKGLNLGDSEANQSTLNYPHRVTAKRRHDAIR